MSIENNSKDWISVTSPLNLFEMEDVHIPTFLKLKEEKSWLYNLCIDLFHERDSEKADLKGQIRLLNKAREADASQYQLLRQENHMLKESIEAKDRMIKGLENKEIHLNSRIKSLEARLAKSESKKWWHKLFK